MTRDRASSAADCADHNAARFDTLEADLAALRDELAQRGEILLAREQDMDDLNHAIATLSQMQVDLRDADDRQRDSDTALAQAHAEIDRILNSRSVRMMAPAAAPELPDPAAVSLARIPMTSDSVQQRRERAANLCDLRILALVARTRRAHVWKATGRTDLTR